MRKSLALLAAAAAVVFVGASRSKRKPAAEPPKASGLALVGDSLAVGLVPRLRELAQAAGVPFYSDAQGGAGVLVFTPARLEPVPSGALVVVSLGGNDRQATWRADQLPAAVKGFVCALRPRSVVWLDMPFPTLPDRVGASDLWRACAEALEVGSADDWASERAGDGVHLTPAGYRRLAELVWSAVAPRIAQNGTASSDAASSAGEPS